MRMPSAMTGGDVLLEGTEPQLMQARSTPSSRPAPT